MTFYHSHELKIKASSLAAESRIIRRIEQKLFKAARHHAGCGDKAVSLYFHRKGLSGHSRNTLLAYGFLKGKPYASMEPKRYSDPNWTDIERMALQYGTDGKQAIKQRFEEWKQAAGEPAVYVPKPRIRPSNKVAA